MIAQASTPERTRELTIIHTASLHGDDQVAFDHAVAIARRSGSSLVSIHADGGVRSRDAIPRAVDSLVRWGALPATAVEGDEAKLGIRHERRAHDCCADDHVATLLDAMRGLDPDLVIMTTHHHGGLSRALFGSVAESFALEVARPVLFLPIGTKPFVEATHGALDVARIVVAAGDQEATAVGLAHAVWFADVVGASSVAIDLVHAGHDALPEVPTVVDHPNVEVAVRAVGANAEDAILDAAERSNADVVVMATRGHDSLRDVLAGSHTERVLRRARTPLLSIPLH